MATQTHDRRYRVVRDPGGKDVVLQTNNRKLAVDEARVIARVLHERCYVLDSRTKRIYVASANAWRYDPSGSLARSIEAANPHQSFAQRLFQLGIDLLEARR